ncbi:DUF397 domain-containing protein [Kribbella sp. NPDC056861]|uniref:DUF397 domain-containing protein n=1 Tax=Kribbella sp. NPDC056861 TaxID=3154857 RepID=UPI003419DF2B
MSLAPLVFRKSSFSQTNDCVQWAHATDGVHLGDTKDPGGVTFRVSHREWDDFTSAVLAGAVSPGRLIYRAEPTGVSVFLTADPALSLKFNESEWTAFTSAIAAGEVHLRSAG